MRTYDVLDSIKTDVAEQVRYLFTGNEMPHDRESLIGDLREVVHTAIDNSLIYTSDILALWEDAGRPEPFELGMADTIEGSITNAIYGHLCNEAEAALFDGTDEALEDLREKILAGEIAYSWSEPDTFVNEGTLTMLREADAPEEIFDALAAFRAEVEI